MEGEEGDSERQCQARQRKAGPAGSAAFKVPTKKSAYLNTPSMREVRSTAAAVASLRRASRAGVDHQCGGIIERDLCRQQSHEARLAPGIERQRGQQQNEVLRRDAGRQAIDEEEQRQKVEQEGDRREQQFSRASRAAMGFLSHGLTDRAAELPQGEAVERKFQHDMGKTQRQQHGEPDRHSRRNRAPSTRHSPPRPAPAGPAKHRPSGSPRL